VEDNFFDLGGHSIKAVQVIAALRSTFGVEAAMRHLFERPTIAGLASIVDVLAIAANRDKSVAGGLREEFEI
jgi:acyl carrier protein